MLEFASPWFLLLLLGLPLLAWPAWRRRRGATLQYSDLSMLDSAGASWRLWGRRLLPAFRLAALALLIVALARPQFGNVERDVVREGVDLFYVLDISGSMQAEDFEPNRLEVAKDLTADFAAQRPNDRQGIVLFSEVAFVLCPLTFDGGTVRQFLESVDFDSENMRQTAIGMGLARALKKLRDSKAQSKVIILMTDGENNAGTINPVQAAQVAKKLGVRIYTIGIGSRGLAPITVRTAGGLQRRMIRTSIDEALLVRLARETGGQYRRATSGAQLEEILREIDALEKTEIEMKEYRNFEERMAWLCWPALFLLVLELILARTLLRRLP